MVLAQLLTSNVCYASSFQSKLQNAEFPGNEQFIFSEPSPYASNKGRCSKLATKMFASLCLPPYV